MLAIRTARPWYKYKEPTAGTFQSWQKDKCAGWRVFEHHFLLELETVSLLKRPRSSGALLFCVPNMIEIQAGRSGS
jgi:hypothetical protein